MSSSDSMPTFCSLDMSVYPVSLASWSMSISIHITTYIFYKPYSILNLCVTWPVKVNVCAVGLFYNLSVRRTLCFFRIVVLFLCVVFVRLFSACKFLLLLYLLFKFYKCNREKDNKKMNKIFISTSASTECQHLEVEERFCASAGTIKTLEPLYIHCESKWVGLRVC